MLGFAEVRGTILAALLIGLSASAAAYAQPVKKKLQPWLAERLALCDGSALKPSVTNPKCERWQIMNITSDRYQDYAGAFPRECYYGSNNQFYCFFPKTASGQGQAPVRTCRAYAKGETLYKDRTDPGNGVTPFCGTGAYAQPGGKTDFTQFRCSLCDNNQIYQSSPQLKCTGGKYIQGEVCGSSLDIHESFDIANDLTVSYCDKPVNGRYRNVPDSYKVCSATQTQAYRGMRFPLDQKAIIKKVNRDNNSQQLRSDLAGFCYPKTGSIPCTETSPGSNVCKEPDALVEMAGQWNSPEVHHVLPRTDRRGCPCGSNSMANASVISRSLNNYLSNQDRVGITSLCAPFKNEIQWIEDKPPHIFTPS